MNNQNQKWEVSLKRMFGTAEGLKVFFTLAGLLISIFPLIWGNAEPIAVVLICAALIWGWRQALVILGVSTIAGLFARSLVFGIILLVFVPFIAFAAGCFQMIIGIVRYAVQEIAFLAS